MSNAICRRTAVVAVSGLFAGLPLLGLSLLGSPAWAAAGPTAVLQTAATPEDSPDVSFSGGGLGVLLCGSRPATGRITVSAETKVKLTNKLGQSATLRVDGEDSAVVADGDTVELQFHRGPVSVAMVPECLLNLNPKFEPLTVDVARQAPPSFAAPSNSSSSSNSKPGTTAPAPGAPSSTAKPGGSPKVGGGASAGTRTGAPQDPGSAAPTGDESSTPSTAELPPVPPDLFGNEADNGSDPSPSASVNVTVIDSQRTSNQSLRGPSVPIDNGPIGLLSIIATVCVVGVSAGAIRAIIAQRATRAEFA